MDVENRPPDRTEARLFTPSQVEEEKRAAWTMGLIAGATTACLILWARRKILGWFRR